jgi:hypothetical protein
MDPQTIYRYKQALSKYPSEQLEAATGHRDPWLAAIALAATGNKGQLAGSDFKRLEWTRCTLEKSIPLHYAATGMVFIGKYLLVSVPNDIWALFDSQQDFNKVPLQYPGKPVDVDVENLQVIDPVEMIFAYNTNQTIRVCKLLVDSDQATIHQTEKITHKRIYAMKYHQGAFYVTSASGSPRELFKLKNGTALELAQNVWALEILQGADKLVYYTSIDSKLHIANLDGIEETAFPIDACAALVDIGDGTFVSIGQRIHRISAAGEVLQSGEQVSGLPRVIMTGLYKNTILSCENVNGIGALFPIDSSLTVTEPLFQKVWAFATSGDLLVISTIEDSETKLVVYTDRNVLNYDRIFAETHQRGLGDPSQRHPQINRLPAELVQYTRQFF